MRERENKRTHSVMKTQLFSSDSSLKGNLFLKESFALVQANECQMRTSFFFLMMTLSKDRLSF